MASVSSLSKMDEGIRERSVNMHSFNHLIDIALSDEVIKKSVHKVTLKRKKHRKCKQYTENEERTCSLAHDWIINYENDTHKPKLIEDGITHKIRTIIVPTYKELVVQHCVVQALQPMFMRGMYEHSYASIPNRGAHKAKKYIEKWIANDKKNCKYVLKMDIRHFFDSIPHDILKQKLGDKIHDTAMLNIMFKIIDVTDKGLPLGFYTSQWLSNWYLQDLDHYIKEDLQAVYYVRYMDDMVIFGSNKKRLHHIRILIEKYLKDELGLELKDNWQVYRFDYIKNGKHYGRDLDFMGFRFFRKVTILRKSIMRRAKRKAIKVGNKDRPTIYDIRQMLSYNGWLKVTDTYGMYLKYIKPYVDFKKLKKRISNYDKRNKEVINNANNIQAYARLTSRATTRNRHYIIKISSLPTQEYRASRTRR